MGSEETKKLPNWFERHINWTAGIFGHLMPAYISVSLMGILPLPFFHVSWIAMRFISNLHEIDHMEKIFNIIFATIALVCYFSINYLYLKVKKQSYLHLLWLIPPIFTLIYALLNYVSNRHFVINISGALRYLPSILLLFSSSIWFLINAIILLRLPKRQ